MWTIQAIAIVYCPFGNTMYVQMLCVCVRTSPAAEILDSCLCINVYRGGEFSWHVCASIWPVVCILLFENGRVCCMCYIRIVCKVAYYICMNFFFFLKNVYQIIFQKASFDIYTCVCLHSCKMSHSLFRTHARCTFDCKVVCVCFFLLFTCGWKSCIIPRSQV